MGTQTAFQPSTYEQALISIVRTLPVERVVQILDYAHYIQSQTVEDFGFLDDDETEEEILADEALWDAQFAATQDGLEKMADKVRADIQAGLTTPMVFTKDGRIAADQGGCGISWNDEIDLSESELWLHGVPAA